MHGSDHRSRADRCLTGAVVRRFIEIGAGNRFVVTGMSVQTKRIIVGVSGSLSNLAALHAAVDTARRADVPLVAVLAWAPVGGEIAYHRAPCPILLHIWNGLADDRMCAAFDDAFGGTPSGVAIERVVVRAAPGPALVRRANRPGDLLVIGAGRRLGRFRLGVTRYCLRRARCPVLTVEPPAMIHDLHRRHLDDELRAVLADRS